MRAVEPAAWVDAVVEAYESGFTYFDWLGCADEIGRTGTFRIVLVLRNLSLPAADCMTLVTEVPRDAARLASINGVFAGAGWHEREAGELFGIEFVGGERRRLLLDPNFEGTPLRKDEVLAARAAVTWPGAKEPGESDASPSRRRMVPPGVPDPEVWGDRVAGEAPAPAEVAESVVAGRVRRRRR